MSQLPAGHKWHTVWSLDCACGCSWIQQTDVVPAFCSFGHQVDQDYCLAWKTTETRPIRLHKLLEDGSCTRCMRTAAELAQKTGKHCPGRRVATEAEIAAASAARLASETAAEKKAKSSKREKDKAASYKHSQSYTHDGS